MTERTDVVELLKAQHTRIRNLLDEVMAAKGEQRKEHFHELVRLLAVHETAEEEVVHPFARKNIENGELVVNDRIREEERAKEVLSRLDDMDTDSSQFMQQFKELRQNVLDHAEAEEKYEFAQFSKIADRTKLENMARAVKAAEAVAPTRPHPGADTAVKNLAVGPVAAVIDRTRDAIRKAMG
ncbi:hemerythrin domain-containing protein [Streptomyces poonensis]|uniref:Hemerythrin n=1 Tax=Streptomyces poonensis TaxID=68255 RepID=A0A918PGT6_9ACTN|nr:hemerythrin domain-containing protein [Streptomyces poonensis]GGZ05179.1 hemerythrin [Streptomyces poonensis]GLJ89479.1 hemerythrin [Streptomyces poonensis]